MSISRFSPGIWLLCSLLVIDIGVHSNCAPQAGSRALIARRFILTDKSGKPRARLECGKSGDPRFQFLNSQGITLMNLGLKGDSPDLTLAGTDGKPRLTILSEAAGSSGILLYDSHSIPRAIIRIRPDGSALLSLHDSDGTARADLDTLPDGSPGLTLSNKEQKGGAALIVAPSGNPGIVFKNRDGKLIWAAP